MFKSYNNYNTFVHSFEDFLLKVFVLIDGLYQQHVPVSVKNRHNIKKQNLVTVNVLQLLYERN